MPRSSSPERPRNGALIALLAGLIMIGPFSIDTIFPGFPAIGRELGASALAVQQTVSVYLLAYALMSLVHGPLSDRFGRKPVMIIGIAGYAVTAVGAAMAPSLEALLVWRACQGVCAGAGTVVARAVIRDLFEGAAAQKLMSQVMMVFGIAPAVAPILGAQLVVFSGWRGIFWFLAAFAGLLAAISLWRLPESLPAEQRVSLAPRNLARSYRGILGDPGFWPLALSGVFNFSALFLYILSAPHVVMGLMGLSEQGFPWLFVPIIGGMISGAWLSSRMAGRRSAAATVNLGYALMALGTVINLVLGVVLPLPVPRWALLSLYLIGSGVGLATPTLTLLLLDRFPQHRGAASSMQTFTKLMFNALLAGVIAPLLYASMTALAVGAAVITSLGWLAWFWYLRVDRADVHRHTAAAETDVIREAPSSEAL